MSKRQVKDRLYSYPHIYRVPPVDWQQQCCAWRLASRYISRKSICLQTIGMVRQLKKQCRMSNLLDSVSRSSLKKLCKHCSKEPIPYCFVFLERTNPFISVLSRRRPKFSCTFIVSSSSWKAVTLCNSQLGLLFNLVETRKKYLLTHSLTQNGMSRR